MNKNVTEKFVRVLYVVVSVTMVILLFMNVDIHSVSHSVIAIGYSFIGILAAYFFGCVFDTLAWRRLMPVSVRTISFFRLLAIHIAGESFYRFIPAGAVVGESVKLFLARKHFHIEYSHFASSLVLRKLFMAIAQAFYIGCAVLLGIFLYGFGNLGSLEFIGGILAAILFALLFMIGYGIVKGKLGSSIFSLLMKLPSKKLRERILSDQHIFTETDALLQDALRNHRLDALLSTILFFMGWMTELFETILILFSLGAIISVTQAMLFEPVVSLLRSVAFIFPSGLGVMDAGYASAFRLYGLSNAAVIAAAFIVTKRSKDLFWIIIGIVLTIILGGNITKTIMKNI